MLPVRNFIPRFDIVSERLFDIQGIILPGSQLRARRYCWTAVFPLVRHNAARRSRRETFEENAPPRRENAPRDVRKEEGTKEETEEEREDRTCWRSPAETLSINGPPETSLSAPSRALHMFSCMPPQKRKAIKARNPCPSPRY